MKVIKDDRIIDLTPELVAAQFANMQSDDQARFFNHVATIVSTWSRPMCFQLQSITDDENLTHAGREVMQQIGEYSAKTEEGHE
ncbi:MAG: hypothetical protein GY799_25215 [Desulfobulbaceae bacterium]|nr:hypothetical protein [Desulfobulbaceae bacterium]